MKTPSREEQQRLARQWEETGRALEDIRRAKLRGMPYNWGDVEALLSTVANCDGPPRFAEGMVEMQRLFMKRRPRPTDEDGGEASLPKSTVS
jgi:hypothetical protein